MKKIAFVLGASRYDLALYRATTDVASILGTKNVSVEYIFWESPGLLRKGDRYIDIFGLSNASVGCRIFSKIMTAILGKHFYQYLFSPFFVSQFYRAIDRKEYSSIFFHGMCCIPMTSGVGDNYIVVHSCKSKNLLGGMVGIKRRFYKKLYQKVYDGKKLLTVSADVAHDMLQEMGVRPQSIEPIYNGFDFERLKSLMDKPCSAELPPVYLMSAGRPDRTKRFDVLLNAYAKTRMDYPLVIFGDGKKLGDLKKLAIQLGIEDKVFFPGFRTDILGAYKNAVLYVSSSDVEGLPTVIIESLVSGTPVVATDAGGSNELLRGALSKWIVPRGDVNALAKAIDDILLDLPVVCEKDIDFLNCKNIAENYLKIINRECDG